MPQLDFIRHGQTVYNANHIHTGQSDVPLTEKGYADAVEAGKSITTQYDYYICSPLIRTHQTLKALRGDVPFIIDKRVIELGSGEWEGVPYAELPKDQVDLYRAGLLTPPGGETEEEIRARIMSFLDDMFEQYKPEDRILVVCHNAMIRSLRRIFNPEYNASIFKNLQIYPVTNEMYAEMKARENTENK